MIQEFCPVQASAFPVGRVAGCNATCPLFDLCEKNREERRALKISWDADAQPDDFPKLDSEIRGRVWKELSLIKAAAATVIWAISQYQSSEPLILSDLAVKTGVISLQGRDAY